MDGHALRAVIEEDATVRDTAIYGMFGAHVNITDGRHVYMRGPAGDNTPQNHYTLMPTHMRRPFSTRELANMQWHAPLPFTKGCPVMRIPSTGSGRFAEAFETQLFDLATDPEQRTPIDAAALEARMVARLEDALREHLAPPEQYERLGLSQYRHPTRAGTVTVSGKPGHDLARGTWASVMKQAALRE